MNEAEALVLRNILNGVEPAKAALAAGLEEARGQEVFGEAMARVREYQLVMCFPFFPVGSLVEARQHRFQVREILEAMGRWDAEEHELAGAILRGRNVVKEGVARADAERALDLVLKALPHYLSEAEIQHYMRDRAKFVREHRNRVLAALEQFPSLREPLQYKNIETVFLGREHLAANLRTS